MTFTLRPSRVARRLLLGVASGLSFTLIGSTAFAAPPHCTVEGSTSDEQFGASVVSLGDVDGDTFGDFAVGAPFYSVGLQNRGRVYIVSGVDCEVIRTYEGSTASQFLGATNTVAALKDITGDQRSELVLASPNSVRVYNGDTGSLVQTIVPGSSTTPNVADVGDVDNDSLSDIGVSAGSSITLYSGSTFNALDALYNASHRTLGALVAGIQDYDNDGKRDYVFRANLLPFAGNPSSHFGIASSNPSIEQVSAPYGAVCPVDLSESACASVLGAGHETLYNTVHDVNHDGYDDFALSTQVAPTLRNTLAIRSGRYPFKSIHRTAGLFVGDAFGLTATSGDDYDHDGIREIVASGGGQDNQQGYLRILSGSDGDPLFDYFSAGTGFEHAYSQIAPILDVSGDDVGDVALGSPAYGQTELPGGGYVFRGRVLIMVGPRDGADLGGDEYFNIGGTVVVL